MRIDIRISYIVNDRLICDERLRIYTYLLCKFLIQFINVVSEQRVNELD